MPTAGSSSRWSSSARRRARSRSKSAFARPPAQGKGAVYALDAATGKTVWQRQLGSAAVRLRDGRARRRHRSHLRRARHRVRGRRRPHALAHAAPRRQQQLSGRRQGRPRRRGRSEASRASRIRSPKWSRTARSDERRGLHSRRWMARRSRMCGRIAFALAVVLAIAAAATAGARAQAALDRLLRDPPGQSIEQLFRIQPSGDGLQQLTTGAYSSRRSRPSRPTASGSRSRASASASSP